MVIADLVIGQVGHMHCRCGQVNNHDCCQVLLLLVILSDLLLSPQEESSSQGERIQRRDIQDRQYNANGLSGVRALPLAAGINVGGQYKWHFFLLSLSSSGLIANSHRRGCRRVLQFCMGS
jgi:hypothetical protein